MTELPNDPAYATPPPWTTMPASRPTVPGTVQAAAIVTWVCCALTVLMTAFFLLAAVFVGSLILDGFGSADRVDLALAVAAGALAVVVVSALAGWFAWLVWRRQAWARIALTVCSGLALAGSLATFGPHSVVIAPGSVAVIVLLFLPDSNDWFQPAD